MALGILTDAPPRVRRTAAMAVIELQDAALRGGERRDVRQIIGEAFLELGTLSAVAERLEVDPSTLSVWIADQLQGKLHGAATPNARLVFAGFGEFDLYAARLRRFEVSP